jgi:hypothetical protein
MQSCEAQEFIGTFLATKTLLAEVPKMIAARVMQPIRDALPEGFKGLVCRDEDFKLEPFDAKELDCREGRGGDGSGGGAGGRGGEGKEGGKGGGGGERAPGDKEPGGGGPGGDAESGLPVFTAKPVPKDRPPPPAQKTIPALLTEGMPTEDTLDPSRAVPVTLALLRESGGGFEPMALVRGVRATFFKIGEPKNGFVQYTIAFDRDFYIEEIDQVIFARAADGSPFTVSGVP